ncbi:MAG: hypothetical protein WC789_13650 [Lentisphaeria bacterium]|jgi:hypothetical protein
MQPAKIQPNRRFTLTEVLVASAITVLIIGSILPFAISLAKEYAINAVKNDLRNQTRIAHLRMLTDFEGTTNKQVEMPATDGVANGFAIPVRADADAILDNADPADDWQRAAVYYLDGTPSPNNPCQLIRAEVPYAEFQAHKDTIVADFRTGNTDGYTVLASRAILHRVTAAEIGKATTAIDCYAPAAGKKSVNLGAARLTAGGNHTITFQVTGQNQASSGFNLGIDRITTSLSGKPLEAELLTITASDVTPTYSTEDPPLGTRWGNNALLNFAPGAAEKEFTLQFFQETWMDPDFEGDSATRLNLTRRSLETLDPSYPKDIFLELDGSNLVTWEAYKQAGTGFTFGDSPDLQGQTVRVLVPGNLLNYTSMIVAPGGHPAFTFARGTGQPLRILAATVMELDSGFNGKAGTRRGLTFSGGTSVVVGTEVASDPVNGMAFDSTKNYLVSFAVETDPSPNAELAAAWTPPAGFTEPYSLILAGNQADSYSVSGGSSSSQIIGLKEIKVSYPLEGTFESALLDTKLAAPQFNSATIVKQDVADATLTLQYRSSDTGTTTPPSFSLWVDSVSAVPSRRYLQYQAVFNTTKAIAQSPKLRNLTIEWQHGQTQEITLGAEVAVGPDKGQFNILIDGAAPVRPYYRAEFTIDKEFLGKTYESVFTLEVSPRIP